MAPISNVAHKLTPEEAKHSRLLELGVQHLVDECGVDEASAREFTEQYLDSFEEAKQMLDVAKINGWNGIVEAWKQL